MSWTTLDNFFVSAVTERAVLLKNNESGAETWIPRTMAQDGDALCKGDTDIIVKTWLAEKEGLT